MCVISLAVGLGTSLATALGVSVASGTVLGTAVAGATAAGASTAISAGSAFGIGAGAIGIGALAVGGAAAGGIMSTVSGYQNAQAQAEQAQFQADLAEENARLAFRHSDALELQANQKRAALLRESLQKGGSGRTGYAANGVVLGAGTSAEHEADLANAYDLDLKNLNYDVKMQQWESNVRGTNYLNQASQYKALATGYERQASSSMLGGIIGTIGSTASTAFGVAGGLSKFMDSGSNLMKAGMKASSVPQTMRNLAVTGVSALPNI